VPIVAKQAPPKSINQAVELKGLLTLGRRFAWRDCAAAQPQVEETNE